MDIFSHGLWGGVAFGRRKRSYFFLAIMFGMLPDLLSFGVHNVAMHAGLCPMIDWSKGHPGMSDIPQYVHMLYDISHSLVVFFFVFALIWIIRKRPFMPFLAYGFAVALDIPTHTTDFFATPFLWPLSGYRFNGISWGNPIIAMPNIVLLISAYITWYLFSRRKRL